MSDDARRSKYRNLTSKKLHFSSPADLHASEQNARKHSRLQIRAIADSIVAFGFIAPIVADQNGNILAGHGRFEAAKLLKLRRVPVISIEHLSDVQAKAYMLADNKLTDRSSFDDLKVATQLKELSELELDFNIEAIGFEAPEIDFRIQSLDPPDDTDTGDEFQVVGGSPASMLGDLWSLGEHRLLCGNSLDVAAFTILFESEKATAVISDFPYNVKINGHVSSRNKARREFAMASGEMSETEFTDFLSTSMALICGHTVRGGLIYGFMDWRHIPEIIAAGRSAECDLVNLCVWAKSNSGMGSLYRSRHELVFVFRNGPEKHQNNVQLGRFGRSRSNVWNYPGLNGFGRNNSSKLLKQHPTMKPIALVADAILDSTKRGEIVHDPFLGSGTTILAAERTGRRCYGIEIDPIYVDTAIERWQRMTGHEARNARGETFNDIKSSRSVNS